MVSIVISSSLKKREARSLANFVHSPSCEILRHLEHLLAIGNVIANGAEKLVLVTKALKDSVPCHTEKLVLVTKALKDSAPPVHLLAIRNLISNGVEKLVLVTKALKDSTAPVHCWQLGTNCQWCERLVLVTRKLKDYAIPGTFVGNWERNCQWCREVGAGHKDASRFRATSCNCQWCREVGAGHKGAKRFRATSYICWQLETYS